VQASAQNKTAATALASLNTIFNAVIKILNNLGVATANYSTSYISIYPVYNYSGSYPYPISGASASETITITLSNTVTLTKFLQAVKSVNVTIYSLTFDLSNRANAFKQARVAAFADAKNKFNSYLSLSSLKNGGLRKIWVLNGFVYTPYSSSPDLYALSNLLNIPPSPVQIQASVAVTWKVQS
jgi:uncharacterized protein YggE